LAITYNSYM